MSRTDLSAASRSIILMMLPVPSHYLPALLADLITGCLTRYLQTTTAAE